MLLILLKEAVETPNCHITNMIDRNEEISQIGKYRLLLQEYYNKLTGEFRSSLNDDVIFVLQERGLDSIDEFIEYSFVEKQGDKITPRELLQFKMDMARIFNVCFDKLDEQARKRKV